MTDSLRSLVDRYIEIVHSPRNQANARLWDHSHTWERANWRALPNKPFRFVMDPARVFVAQALGFSLVDYYENPEAHLIGWLKQMIYRFEHFDDNTYFPPYYAPWWGIVTEASYFGIPVVFRADKDPVLDAFPLEDKSALERMTLPDFYTSGLMPKVIEFTKVGEALLGDAITSLFPTWARGPLSTAMSLRGMERLLLDMLDDPPFVHRLMRFVTDARKSWLAERAHYLNQPLKPALLFNDEIGAPLLSPRMYREFVLPYEKELAEFQGGVFYWHSCGNTTALIKDVATLPGLQMFHVGPQTDLKAAIENLSPQIALDICVQDVRDVYEADDEMMRAKLREIANVAGARNYFVRADEFAVIHTLEQDLAKMVRWVEIAREVSAQVQ